MCYSLSTRHQSASIFNAEICAIIKFLEQSKDSVASKYIISTDSVSPSFTIYETGTSLDCMVIRKCDYLNFANKTSLSLFFSSFFFFFWGGGGGEGGTQPYLH